MKIKPYNRYLLIDPCDTTEDDVENAILVPEDYKPKDFHTLATIVDIAEDCKDSLTSRVGSKLICTTNMVEEVKVGGKVYYLLLENYILCLVS